MEKRCIYCGQPITKKPAAVWLKREKEEVQCCSMDCYNKTSRFIKWDQASRLKAYVIIGICAAVNLISIGFSMEGWWTHIPLVVIGMCLCQWPLVFMHFHNYEKFGIPKTLRYVRFAAGALIVFGAAITVWDIFFL